MFLFLTVLIQIRLLLIWVHTVSLIINVSKNMLQTTWTAFSDEFFVGALRVKTNKSVQEILVHIV